MWTHRSLSDATKNVDANSGLVAGDTRAAVLAGVRARLDVARGQIDVARATLAG